VERLDVVAGNFFAELPPRGDAYVISQILLLVEGVIPDRRSAGEASFDLFTLMLSEADSERWTSSGDVRSPPI
jgi:hypothetical protein